MRTPPSILLQNIHCSLPVLSKLYASQASRVSFPPIDPKDEQEGQLLFSFFCKELGMGEAALTHWRRSCLERMTSRWCRPEGEHTFTHTLGNPTSKEKRILRTRPLDYTFLQKSIERLKLLVSPLITLCDPPEGKHNSSHGSSSAFHTIAPVKAGMFLLSLPTEAALMVPPLPVVSGDLLLSYFMNIEDLIAQLLAVEEEGEVLGSAAGGVTYSSHYHYVKYLQESIVPCKNLPFLSEKELTALLGDGAEEVNPLQRLCGNTITAHVGRAPLSGYVRDRLAAQAAVDLPQADSAARDKYVQSLSRWWYSVILSRRSGSSMLLPVLDKLNHSPNPNCYYTMSFAPEGDKDHSEDAFCGIDVFDNLLAGVPLDLLTVPYIHLFAIRDMQAGEEITISYGSPHDSLYPPASRQLPTPTKGSTESYDELLQGMFHAPNSVEEILRNKLHQEVHTAEGKARWQTQWGFIPATDSLYSEKDLRVVSSIVAERRLDLRQSLFPLSQ
ncbi:hypothetical protein AGDE_06395 [Angomonas deanei]|nr:hypothetical protein AGDE_06395 [Angomonas deanei]|eukprot:EPY37539.1 hypothetical protein AGDE_06395 [Angomonas deanei]